MTDYERLESAVKWAEVEAEKGNLSAWNQGGWAVQMNDLMHSRFGPMASAVMASLSEPLCETAFCIAGHVAYEAGLVKSDSNGWISLEGGADWHETGKRLLDINEAQAHALFNGANDIEQVRFVAEQIKAGVEEPTRYLPVDEDE